MLVLLLEAEATPTCLIEQLLNVVMNRYYGRNQSMRLEEGAGGEGSGEVRRKEVEEEKERSFFFSFLQPEKVPMFSWYK